MVKTKDYGRNRMEAARAHVGPIKTKEARASRAVGVSVRAECVQVRASACERVRLSETVPPGNHAPRKAGGERGDNSGKKGSPTKGREL